MEKKQSIFSALKAEVVRGLSPRRNLSSSPARTASPISVFLRRKKNGSKGQVAAPEMLLGRSMSLRPVIEGPDPEGGEGGGGGQVGQSKRFGSGLGNWMKAQILTSTGGSSKRSGSDLRLLLGVMGAPLAPLHVTSIDPLPHLCIKDTPIETCSAQYILQQYTAASGGQQLQNSIRSTYVMGKLKMVASEFETALKSITRTKNNSKAEIGCFVLWQMKHDMWYVELAVGGCKVRAGCNGKLVWRYTPWLGSHIAKGPARPLRRALQGLDPRTTVAMFADAKCIGEKKINNEECFVLKLCADTLTLKARSEGPAEVIRHVVFGYFSQKTGLLAQIEDSHLTRIQSSNGDAVYWETTINTVLEDYRAVEGIMIAHSGRSIVTVYRFGEEAMSHTKTRMEESWTIEEVEFNVPGLSADCFIPPADLRSGSTNDEAFTPSRDENEKTFITSGAKITALNQSYEWINEDDPTIWKMEH